MTKSQLLRYLDAEFRLAKKEFQRINSSRDEGWRIKDAASKYLLIKKIIREVKRLDSLD